MSETNTTRVIIEAGKIDKKAKLQVAVTSKVFKDFTGVALTAVGAIIYEKADKETGELKEYTAIITKEEGAITGNSSVINDEISDLISMGVFDDNGEFNFTITLKKTNGNSGREFATIEIL